MSTATSPESRPQPLLGILLRMMRVTHQVSLRELAASLGVSHSHLSRIESGERHLTPDLEDRMVHAISELPAPKTGRAS